MEQLVIMVKELEMIIQEAETLQLDGVNATLILKTYKI